MTDYTGSVWIDDQPIVSGVPLKTDLDVERAPEIALRRGPDVAVKLWIDDLDVRFVDVSRMGEDRAKLVFRPLFRDNFNRYESDLFPGGGWLQGPGRFAGEAGSPGREAEEDGKVRRKAAVVDDRVYASGSRSFRLEGSEEEPGTVMKRFSLPDRVPFAVSAETFVIVGPGEEGRVERGSLAGSWRVSGEDGRLRKRESEDADRDRNRPALNQRSDRPRREASSVKLGIESAAGSERMMSGPFPSGTFYIYSFDGRLLAEYDVLGNWVKDYIYFGGQLVAEHRAGALYYYASDQIRSTRIVTDSTGAVIYSAAHEPYGGIQHNWVTNYDPELKFSGKPRDAESGLDYFGARYYDHSLYRFLSVDPVIPVGRAVSNPQRWNLYAYCLNSPITHMDLTGEDPIKITIIRGSTIDGVCYGSLYIGDSKKEFGNTTENASNMIEAGTYKGALVDRGNKNYAIVLMASPMYENDKNENPKPYFASIMPGGFASTHNCIMLWSEKTPSQDLMWLLAASIEAYAQVERRALLRLEDSQERSLYASGLDIIFHGWDGLEALSSLISSWEKLAIEVEITIINAQ